MKNVLLRSGKSGIPKRTKNIDSSRLWNGIMVCWAFPKSTIHFEEREFDRLNISRIQRYLEKHRETLKVVSFDVFDTMLMRLVPWERVVQIAAENLSHLLQEKGFKKLAPNEILESRSNYQQSLGAIKGHKAADWTISSWLKTLSGRLAIEDQSLCELGFKAELAAERISLSLNENAMDALSLAGENGRRVIAVSDTWLDVNLLEELLENFGLIFDRVFSSGTSQSNKKNGTLFLTVQNEMKLPAAAFLHVGDNLESDFLRPKKARWRCLWVPRTFRPFPVWTPTMVRKKYFASRRFYEIEQILDIPKAPVRHDPFYRLAYDYLAPLLIIFSIIQWRKFAAEGIEHVFYLSRDSRGILDVYEILAPLLPGSCTRSYIRLSKKVITIVHPDDPMQNALPLACKLRQKSVESWLSGFQFDPRLKQRILEQNGLQGGSEFNETNRELIRAACRNLSPEIENEKFKIHSLLIDYLKQASGENALDRIGIVDTGYACTQQDIIRGVLNGTEVVSGMYLGVSGAGHPPTGDNRKFGLLRDEYRPKSYHNPLEATAGVVRIWDTLLREAVGTVLAFERGSAGEIIPILDEDVAIGEYETRAAAAIRKGIKTGTKARLQRAELLTKICRRWNEPELHHAAARIATHISTYPTLAMAKAILKLQFDEGTTNQKAQSLGISNFTDFISWYPGILTRYGLGALSAVLIFFARVAIKINMRTLHSKT